MKKRYLTTLPFLLIANIWGADDALLSGEKQEILRQQQSIYESEHEKLRYNWISPINLIGNYSYDKSAASDASSTTAKGYATITQDIFRSGGIEYQITYADAKYGTQKLTLAQKIASLNLQLFTSLLIYRQKQTELAQSELKLKNDDIAITIKKHLYEAGKADITELNGALMEKSADLKSNVTLHYAIASARYDITKISDIDPDVFTLATFTLIERQRYLDEGLDLEYARAQNRMDQELYSVTQTQYLPSLSLNTAAGYMDFNPQNRIGKYNGNFYNVGITLTVPFAYNGSATIQEAKATHLKQVADTADREREANATYTQSLELVKNYTQIIAISHQNTILYDELISATKAGFEAGTKTGYDLQTIQNTKAIEELNIKINELSIQRELAKLHFATQKTKEL